MKDKTCMITGANSGIGKYTAIGLAELGANIVMVCRNKGRGEEAQKEIIEKSGNESVDLLLADLSSQKEIRKLTSDFKRKHTNLHVLINNAGIILKNRTLSVDNIEMNLAVNYLAPFLLTNLLLDVIKESAPARIINVSSGGHGMTKMDLEDLQNAKNYSSFGSYGHSKLALMLFTYQLSRRLENTGVTVNALQPGMVRTNLGRDQPFLARLLTKIFFRSPKKGAQTSIYLASSPDVEGITGKYFKDRKITRSTEDSYNLDYAVKLWTMSEKLVEMKAF